MRGFVRRLADWPAYGCVCLMLSVFFVVALASTWTTFLNFHLDGIGYYDLSVNQQALSSTIHSNQPFPFYEATNCGKDGRCSFLLVHPVFLAYLVAGPYAAWPSPFTLFAIQDLMLALAALPLFAIARRVTGSNRLSIATVGIYLVWLPSFSGIFSFHWEAFIPVEFFLIFWLWLTDRYLLAFPVILVSVITLEIVPILLFFMAVYFLIPWLRPSLKLLRAELRLLRRRKDSRFAQLRTSVTRIRKAVFGQRRVWASLYLLVGCAAAYVLLHEFVTTGGFLLGLPPLPSKYNIALSRPVYVATFTLPSLRTAWESKLVFWLVIYATLAMVPLLAPRTFILAAPWIVFSLFASSGYYRMGDQYAFVSSALLLIGFVYGVARLKQWSETGSRQGAKGEPPGSVTEQSGERPQVVPKEPVGPETPPVARTETSAEVAAKPSTTADAPSTTEGSLSAPSPSNSSLRRVRRRRAARASLTVVLIGVIALNLFLSPLNPLAATLKVDRPFVPQGSVDIFGGFNPTDYNHMEELVSMIGSRSIVAVSPMLFPFVANDPYAYPLLSGMDDSNLPFNTSAGTQYVILLSHGNTIPALLQPELYNASEFGVRAWIPATYLGPILLFQRSYNGPTEALGAAPVFDGGIYTAGSGLEPGHAGIIAVDSSSQSGTVIEPAVSPGGNAHQNLRETGPIFLGPGVTLPGGSYQVTVVLKSPTPIPLGWNESTPVVTIFLSGYQVALSSTILNFSALSCDCWTHVTVNVTIPYPVLDFTVTGSNHRNLYQYEVDYVSIQPSSPP